MKLALLVVALVPLALVSAALAAESSAIVPGSKSAASEMAKAYVNNTANNQNAEVTAVGSPDTHHEVATVRDGNLVCSITMEPAPNQRPYGWLVSNIACNGLR
jgi:hypothetical protein